MESGSRVVVATLVLVALAGGGYWWWTQQQPAPAPAPKIAAPVVPPAPPPAPPAPAQPAIQHPLEGTAARPALPPLDESDPFIKNALIDLLGRKSVLSFLGLDGIARRFVATVDNLATEHASAELWPVNPTAGRFEADARGAGPVIGEQNAARYAATVRFLTAVDTRRAVALYVRLYPLFQQTYEELGNPGKYFNDRVVEVIDHLLETPDVPAPIKVKVVAAEGGAASKRPPLYQFDDPALERRSAGQKILLRVGPDNAAKLRATLADLRRQVTKNAGRLSNK